MGSFSSATHPLARYSRSRRRLLIYRLQLAASSTPPASSTPSASAEVTRADESEAALIESKDDALLVEIPVSAASAAVESHHEHVTSIEAVPERIDAPAAEAVLLPPPSVDKADELVAKTNPPATSPEKNVDASVRDESAGVEWTASGNAVREMQDGNRAITWVFTGDRLARNSGNSARLRHLSELFAAHLQSSQLRAHDVVIDTTKADGRCDTLLDDLQWRVLRFSPDVVSIVVGLNDSVDGPSGLSRFRENLTTLINRLQCRGTVVLLQTPNSLNSYQLVRQAALPTYVRTMRDVAAACGAILVDHWLHWRHMWPDNESLQDWLDVDGIHPNAAGHEELYEFLLHTLDGIDEIPWDSGKPSASRSGV